MANSRALVATIAALAAVLASLASISPAAGTTPDPGADSPDPGACLHACADGGVTESEVYSAVGQLEPGGSGGEVVPTGNSYQDDCTWSPVDAGETRILHPIAGAWEVTFTEDSWVLWCAPSPVARGYFPRGESPPQWVIDEMIRYAYESTPVLFFNPRSSPEGTTDIAILVQTPTFYWVDKDLWRSVEATAAVPELSVTTTAEPYLATFSGGDDPATVDCYGPGEPYRYGVGGPEGNDQSCSSIFRRDSTVVPDRQITLSVRWRVSYTCSAYCAGGPLPDIITESVRDVVVTEIQAVEN